MKTKGLQSTLALGRLKFDDCVQVSICWLVETTDARQYRHPILLAILDIRRHIHECSVDMSKSMKIARLRRLFDDEDLEFDGLGS